jgi:hypothetical protein
LSYRGAGKAGRAGGEFPKGNFTIEFPGGKYFWSEGRSKEERAHFALRHVQLKDGQKMVKIAFDDL